MKPKILREEELVSRLSRLKARKQTIVFTNGCFDILHAGHVRYLAAARAFGDVLVVGLNSDVSVKKIKDSGRPINPQDQRAEVLAALACVDFVTLFDSPDPLNLIRAVSPDVLVKGADWAESEIIGADFVKKNSGRVERIRLVPDTSTTAIIQKILNRYADMSDGPASC